MFVPDFCVSSGGCIIWRPDNAPANAAIQAPALGKTEELMMPASDASKWYTILSQKVADSHYYIDVPDGRGSIADDGPALVWIFNAHIEGMAESIPNGEAEGSIVEELAKLDKLPALNVWIKGAGYDTLQERIKEAVSPEEWDELKATYHFAPVGLQSKKDPTVALARDTRQFF